MGRLSKEQLTAEVKRLGYELLDCEGYQNMSSPLTLKCSKGHIFSASLEVLRRPSFICPQCDVNVHFTNPSVIPPKGKQRIIGIDQATEKFGLSI